MKLEPLEALAFGPERASALAQLVPGTEEHDYWRCVHLQHAGTLDEVTRILLGWRKRHGDAGARFQTLRRRQLLLLAGIDLPAHAERLREDTGAVVWHEPEAVAATQRFATSLDQGLISREALLARALASATDLSHVSSEGLPHLTARALPPSQRRHLLQRLTRGGLPGLVDAIDTDLGEPSSGGFGSLAAHQALTLEELMELGERRRELRDVRSWVDAVLTRLAPPPHVDWQVDGTARAAHLRELWGFASTLGPTFNGLRALVLFHQLDADLRQGVLDRGRFLAYLDLPRSTPIAPPDWLRGFSRDHVVPAGVAFPSTGLGPLPDDLKLVRSFLTHFLATEDASAFEGRCERRFLDEALAEARLLAGAPEPERWVGVLGPSRVADLRERVELEFAPHNPATFGAADPVALEVDVKNVPSLVVKVFRVDTRAHFLARGAEVDAAIDLDGLVARDEVTLRFDAPPMRRVRRRIELPGCARPGTYIVELVGGGRSSRALLVKGALLHTSRVGAAGVVIDVLDERGARVPDASILLGGREYLPREDGGILIPFTTRPRRVPMLLVAGDVAVAAALDHPAESYALTAGFHVEEEALVGGKRAKVLLRPTLTVAGSAIPISLLQEPRLELSVTDLSGTTSSRSEPIELLDDREAVVELGIPDDTAELALHVSGHVRTLSTQDRAELSSGVRFALNGIHATEHVEALHLATTERGHVLFLLGKTGEARGGRAVNVSLKHRAVTWELTTTLETDARGRIVLGELQDVERVTATVPSSSRTFALSPRPPLPARLHLLEGERFALPLAGAGALEPGAIPVALAQLVELRGDAAAHDRTDRLRVERDAVIVEGLPPGAHRLSLPWGTVSLVVVAAASTLASAAASRWACSRGTALTELSPPLTLLRGLRLEGGELVVELSGASDATRVHVLATRFRAQVAAPSGVSRDPGPPRSLRWAPRPAEYLSGRDLGDELRYVLDRRAAPRRPGTMLERPPLLLQPWALRTTQTDVQRATGGGAYESRMRAAAMPAPLAEAPQPKQARPSSGYVTLDFLPAPAFVLANLRPQGAGELAVVRVARADLGEASHVRVLVVDPTWSASGELGLPETPLAARDLSLQSPLPMDAHYAEDKRIEGARAGAELVFQDRRAARYHLVDSVARAHQLLLTLTPESGLHEFAFVARWHILPEDERKRLYSEHACHELHLFLYFKDRRFFDAVARPHLLHKRRKALVDDFVLERDLERYLEPWIFGRLNTVERLLLAKRLPSCRGAVTRLIRDAVDLLSPEPERDAQLVDSLLGAAALEGGGGGPEEDLLAAPAPSDEAPAFSAAAGPPGFGAPGFGPPPAPAAAPAGMPPPPVRTAAAAGGAGSADSTDLADRGRSEQLFRGADRTEELAETHWRRVRAGDSGPALVPPNRFWRDLAEHTEGPFTSPHVGDCTASFADSMCALALLDVPFSPGPHELRAEDDERLVLTLASSSLVARAQLLPVTGARGPQARGGAAILVGQSLLRADDRWEWQGAQQREKQVAGELLVGVVYACRVVVTNPTSARQDLDVLVQIPERSIPVSRGRVTRTHPVSLPPYATASIEYAFYFPRPGRFSHFPAHVSRSGELLAAAEARRLEVSAEPSHGDTISWAHASQHGSLDDVLALLRDSNLGRLDLGKIAWRMRDRAAFEQVTSLLAERRVFDSTLWAYALRHHDRARAAEWLQWQDAYLAGVGPSLTGALVDVRAEERGGYEHLEYAPLINARAHPLGNKRHIPNDALGAQFRAFLELHAHEPSPDDDARLAACHYLLCLDRVDDALAMLARVEPSRVSTPMQLAYLSAYAASCSGELERARELSAPYADHPAVRWRSRFRALLAALDEADGKGAAAAQDDGSRNERMAELAARQPTLEVAVEAGSVVLTHTNLDAIELRFHEMDLELLFSRQPFVKGEVERFSFVEPRVRLAPSLEPGGTTRVPLPEGLASSSLVIEALAAGTRRAVPHYASDLAVQVSGRYGQLRVARASTGAALPAVYVKVYGRQRGGAVSFYKDGYTDLRGRFDYATLSTDDLDRVERFALLVASDDHGATVLEADPPAR